MSFKDTLSMAVMNLWRRKLRSFLTMLGMAVGTASIIVMISLGIGINVSYQESLASYGSLTKITVSPQNWNAYYEQMEGAGGGSISISGQPETVDINDKAIEAMKQLEHVTAVTPVLSTWSAYIKSNRYVNSPNLYAIDPATADEFDIKLQEGEMFSDAASGGTVELVVGPQFVQNFYNPSNGTSALDRDGNPRLDPMTSRFRLTFDSNNVHGSGGSSDQTPGRWYNIKVTGVLQESADWSTNTGAYTSIAALKKLQRENKKFMYDSSNSSTYSEAWVKADSIDNVAAVQKELEAMGFGTSSLGDSLQQMQDSSKSLRVLLGAIGGVALLVAAIGIMNTMMMAIYERTKEIGVFKVLGCKMGNIRSMFLSESAVIGFLGGLLGMIVSYALGAGLNGLLTEMGMRSVIPVWLSAGAVAFSVVVAMVSGLYPSMKAMRLSPLAAIRTE